MRNGCDSRLPAHFATTPSTRTGQQKFCEPSMKPVKRSEPWGLVSAFSGIKIWIADLRKHPDAAKILIIRALLVCFLIGAALATTIQAYGRFKEYENKLYKSRFETVSQSALRSVVESFSSMNMGIQTLSNMYGGMFPNETDWPNAAWTGFHPTTVSLGRTSAMSGMAVFPLVRAQHAQSFAAFTSDYYDSDPYCSKEEYMRATYPNGEVWMLDYSTFPATAYVDPLMNSSSTDPEDFMTPMIQYTVSPLAGLHLVNYNVRTNPLYTKAIDTVYKCAKEELNFTKALNMCGAISLTNSVPARTFLNPNPVIQDMVAVFFQPIIPAFNQSSVVGFTAGTISWRTLLTGVMPSDVNGIDCVIQDSTGAFTFTFQAGMPVFKGREDLHDREYSRLHATSVLPNDRVTAEGSPSYTVTFYASHSYEQSFMTTSPLRSALIMVGIFVFCSALFGSYDILMHREFDKNQAVLDTKRRFVRFISHEIRTPLNTVRLGMKLLEVEMGKVAEKLGEVSPADLPGLITASLAGWKLLADEIVESSESAVEVLNDLLNYDKIEIGTLKLDYGYFNIRNTVDKVVTAMQVQALEKGITLYLDCRWAGPRLSLPMEAAIEEGDDSISIVSVEEDDRTVVGDATRMSQVLRNLISNALKFTPALGDVTVTVVVSSEVEHLPERIRIASPIFQNLQPAGTVKVAVKDSGAGLTPKQLEEICAEGVQFNPNELQAGQGSGLGLFISKGIVEQHGGRLVVTSEGLGKGVTFTVELPLFRYDLQRKTAGWESTRTVRSGVDSSDKSASLKEGASAGDDTWTPHTPTVCPQRSLIVVDDSPFNRKMLVRLLMAQNHTCVEAENGEEAIQKYSELINRGQAPDAILMDFEMPVMNGPTATAKLREMGCTCLIVGVTGNVLPEQIALYKSKGANAVLPKPVRMEQLTELLANAVTSFSQARSSRQKPVPRVASNKMQVVPVEEV